MARYKLELELELELRVSFRFISITIIIVSGNHHEQTLGLLVVESIYKAFHLLTGPHLVIQPVSFTVWLCRRFNFNL